MLKTSQEYIYQPLRTELSNTLSSINKSEKIDLDDLNDDNEDDDSRIILDEKADIHLPKVYFDNSRYNSSNTHENHLQLENNKFLKDFSTPKKNEKIELIPDVFNCSPSENKNVIVSDLDIKLVSTNKQPKKNNFNYLEKGNDLKKVLEKNLKDYFEKNFEGNINNHLIKNEIIQNKTKIKKQRLMNIKDSLLFHALTSEGLKKNKSKNIYKSVPKKDKKITFYHILGKTKNINEKKNHSLKKVSSRKNTNDKITNSHNSTNYSSSGNNKNYNNNNNLINQKISDFKIFDAIKTLNKTIPKSTSKQVTRLSFYKDQNFFQTFCSTESNSKYPLSRNKNNELNNNINNKCKIHKNICDLFSNNSKNNSIRISNKYKLFTFDILNLQKSKRENHNNINVNVYNNKYNKLTPISKITMNLFEKKIGKYPMKKLCKQALTENSLLFKGNRNLKTQKKTNQKKDRNLKHLK